VVDFHVVDRVRLERGCDGSIPFFFGMGEAGAFPIATRSLSGWMLPTERGFAQGVTHAASRVGAALTPALVVVLMIRFGWRMPFFVFGLIGLAWAAAWYWYHRDTPAEHRHCNAAERRLISGHTKIRCPGGSMAQHSSQPLAVDALAHVFLLRLQHRHLP
jgi:MFS family permease